MRKSYTQAEIASIGRQILPPHDLQNIRLPIDDNVLVVSNHLNDFRGDSLVDSGALVQFDVFVDIRLVQVLLEVSVRSNPPREAVLVLHEVVDGVDRHLHFGEREEGDQVSAVGGDHNEHDEPPRADDQPAAVRLRQIHASLLEERPVDVPEAVADLEEAALLRHLDVVVVGAQVVHDVQQWADQRDRQRETEPRLASKKTNRYRSERKGCVPLTSIVNGAVKR